MSLLELFRFLVPYFASLPDDEIQTALGLAEEFRPACLLTTQQDTAQVWYAAGLLYDRQLQAATAATGQTIPVGVKSEKEGDLQREYGFIEGIEDSQGFWKRYLDLAKICGAGAITVGHRYGSCCRAFAGY